MSPPTQPPTAQPVTARHHRPWWVIGEWSIEAFTGVAREHEDMDISILSSDAETPGLHRTGESLTRS